MPTMTQPWYKRNRKGWSYFRTTSLARLRLLFYAVFLLFSTVGFFSDLVELGHLPWELALLNAAASGGFAVLYVLIAVRFSPWLFLPLSVGQMVFWGFDGTLIAKVFAHHLLTPMGTAAGVRFAATGTLIGAVTSYSLFLAFIRSQGSEVFLLQNELALAHAIQQTLVPTISLGTGPFEIYGLSRPSEKVGGDLVDAVTLPSGDAIVYCADIAGHGLAAGILMGMLKTAARTALLDGGGAPETTLPALFDTLNRVLPAVKEPHMYATCAALRLSGTGEVFYALAASPPLLHWRARGRLLRPIAEEQLPLGLLPASGFVGHRLEVEAQDLLVIATDGLLEVCDGEEQEFGLERLGKVVEAHAGEPLDRISEALLGAVQSYGKQSDDQTLLLVRRV